MIEKLLRVVTVACLAFVAFVGVWVSRAEQRCSLISPAQIAEKLSSKIATDGFFNRFDWPNSVSEQELVEFGRWQEHQISDDKTVWGDDVSDLNIGHVVTVEIRGETVWIYATSCGSLIEIFQ